MNNKFLKDAIADAKTLKESAIANAKAVLEESIQPDLKEIFSKKIHEMSEEEDVNENTEINELELDEEEINLSEIENENSEEESIDEVALEDVDSDDEESEDTENEIDMDNMTDEDLVNYIEGVVADMVEAGEIEAGEGAEIEDSEDGEEDEELELDIEDDEEELSEVKSEDETEEKVTELKAELFEAYNTVKRLKESLNDINLLNAKLLYTNKIFKTNNLNEGTKKKVLKSFDKAETISEAKLVFETLVENLNNSKLNKKAIRSKGSASKPNVIKENQNTPIIEVDSQVDRWQKLAGIK